MDSKESESPVSDYYDEPGKIYTREQITVIDASSLTRTVGGAAIGNFTEWFDFGVYSFVVAIISNVFFPKDSSWAIVATFGAMAISFLVRPIGGLFWGFLGDRIGRKAILAYTVSLMAVGTFALGLVPSYAAIGIWAPILLFTLRAVQGFSTGGEYISAMTFLVEHAPDRKRGYLCSFLPVGTLSGYILGALIVVVMKHFLPDDAMHAWGWRIPFLLAGPLGIVGLYVRLHLEETPIYKKEAKVNGTIQVNAWRQMKKTVSSQWKPILVCMGLVLAFNVTDYMLTGYMPTYLDDKLHAGNPLLIIILVLVIIGLLVTFTARLGDHIGRKPVMYTGSILLVLISIPMFLLMSEGGDIAAFLGTMPMGLILLCFMATEPATLPGLFPTEVRSGATAVAYNLSVSAFGGTTPLIAAALIKETGDLMMPAYILIFAGVVGIVSIFFMKEPVGRPLKGSGPIVASDSQARRLATYFRRLGARNRNSRTDA